MRDLPEIRMEIDQINEDLLALLNRRASLALEVKTAKIASGMHLDDYYCPEREQHILEDLIKKNKGPLQDSDIKIIFQAVMTCSLALQRRA
jgi:chorismate mutase-like protein